MKGLAIEGLRLARKCVHTRGEGIPDKEYKAVAVLKKQQLLRIESYLPPLNSSELVL